MKSRRTLALAALALAALIPAFANGEIVRLRDGSSIHGRLIAIAGDTLTFRLSVGPRVKIHRAQVLAIAFDDSLGTMLLGSPAPGAVAAPAPVEAGSGTVSVSFKDGKVSSKISIDKKKDWDAHVRSNHIVVELLMDGAVVYSAIDTTMDKTIYKGHIRQLKNDATLEDFTVVVPAGRYQCQVVIRNFDEHTYQKDFDPSPLHAALVVDDIEVRAGGGVRVDVGVDKGTMKLGKAKLYRVH